MTRPVTGKIWSLGVLGAVCLGLFASPLLAQEPKLRATLKGHTEWVESVAFSSDGTLLASGAQDNDVKLWNVKTAKEKTTLKGHTEAVISVAFSPDGKTLASGSHDKTVRLWDVATGQEKATLKHDNAVGSLAFSGNGLLLASGSWGGKVKLWEVATGQEKTTIKGHHQGQVKALAFAPDDKTLASGGVDKTMRLWDVAQGEEQARSLHRGYVRGVKFSPDGKTLVFSTGDVAGYPGTYVGLLVVWDVPTGKVKTTFGAHTGFLGSFAFSQDGQTLISYGGNGEKGEVRYWDVATEKTRTTVAVQSNNPLAAFSRDARVLAVRAEDGAIDLWEIPTSENTEK